MGQRPEGWGVVVLAAGASSRMGTPKQLLLWENESLLRRAVQTALAWAGGSESGNISSVVCVVLGANAEACEAEIRDLPVLTVVNPEWESGMAGSLRVGVQTVLDAAPNTSGLLVMLCDQPRVGPESLGRLWDAHQNAGLPVTASAYNNTFGVPALFDRAAFADLLRLSGAEGAKSVIGRFVKTELACLVSLPEAADDLDTPGDYARFIPANRGTIKPLW